jgi:hypothetical protein
VSLARHFAWPRQAILLIASKSEIRPGTLSAYLEAGLSGIGSKVDSSLRVALYIVEGDTGEDLLAS